MKSISLLNGSKIVLQDCLGVQRNEKVLIVTDDDKHEIGEALYREAKSLGAEAILMVMEPQLVSGVEPPKPIAAAMKNSDVIICPTRSSLTHTNARIDAVQSGARIATMPGITVEMFNKGAITANYSEVEKLTRKLCELLDKAQIARIEKEGHVLRMSLNNRKGLASTGVYRNPKESGNLPSGEAYIAPIEDSSNGEVIIDGSMVGIGKLNSPIYMKIKNGKIFEMKGEQTEKLQVLLANDQNATLCELGIGTNKNAILCGIILEDEKVYGTVHIAFGTNTSFGGTNKADCHMDGIILKPDLYLDDILLIKQGEFVAEFEL